MKLLFEDDFTRAAKQMTINQDILIQEMTDHADKLKKNSKYADEIELIECLYRCGFNQKIIMFIISALDFRDLSGACKLLIEAKIDPT